AYLNDPTLESVDIAFERMMQTEHDPHDQYGWKDGNGIRTQVHPVIAQSAREMLNKADNEKSGVISTMMSFLSLYRDPIVAHWTEHSDFRITDLQDADRPVSLYLVTDMENGVRLQPLMRLVLQLIVSRLASGERISRACTLEPQPRKLWPWSLRIPEKKEQAIQPKGRRLMLLLDNFPNPENIGNFLNLYPDPNELLCLPQARQYEATLQARSKMLCPETSDVIPGAWKDYEEVLGISGGTLPVPVIEREEWLPATPEQQSALAALEQGLAALVGDIPDGEEQHSVSSRDEDRESMAELSGLYQPSQESRKEALLLRLKNVLDGVTFRGYRLIGFYDTENNERWPLIHECDGLVISEMSPELRGDLRRSCIDWALEESARIGVLCSHSELVESAGRTWEIERISITGEEFPSHDDILPEKE
ncbi:type IV secretory system conjugative DNA transfer family protein, partial [Candidatus Igneacidithiobacillus taiwanensis]|uniref:type IV secretory system conjugative DNA transfer family protein n=1 Tax=Candidatus Igneacidithiobacillus taiwanensis TaxID=1945924 RepID=UPI00289AF040